MAVPILASKSSKRMKNPIDRKIAPLQKEFPSPQIEKTDPSGNYLTPQSIADCGWVVTPPPWLNPNVIADIVTLKLQIEKDHNLLLEHEKILTVVLNEFSELKRENNELKLQNQILQKRDEWNTSEKNARLISDMLNLPTPPEKSIDDVLNDLDGCLRNYSNPEGNTLEDIQDIRSEW